MDVEYVEVAFRPGLIQVYCTQKTSKDYCRAQSGKAFMQVRRRFRTLAQHNRRWCVFTSLQHVEPHLVREGELGLGKGHALFEGEQDVVFPEPLPLPNEVVENLATHRLEG